MWNMTAATKENIRAVEASIKANTATVERKLAESGVKPDIAVVFSAAKNYATIEKLAKE